MAFVWQITIVIIITMISDIRKKRMENNIWKFYLYRFFCTMLFFEPIYVIFLKDNGLNMTEVMLLQAAYTLLIMLLVVPVGVIADYLGTKKVLVFGTAFYFSAFAGYGLGSRFWHFMLAEVLFSIAGATWIVAGTPFFYDTLKELGREGKFNKSYGVVGAINFLTLGGAAFAGGFIALLDMRLTIWLSMAATFTAFLISMSFTSTRLYKHGDKSYFAHLKDAINFVRTHPKMRLFVIYAALFHTVAFIAFMMYQPYLLSVGIGIAGIGTVYLLMNIMGGVGSKFCHLLEEKIGELNLLSTMTLIKIASLIGMAFGIMFIGALFPILIFFIGGIFEPLMNDYINKHTSSHHRATVMSLQMLMINLFSSVAAPLFGWIIDAWSLQAAILMAALLMGLNLLILNIGYWLNGK